MSRSEVLREIEGVFGSVPGFMEALPDEVLSHMWGIMRDLELADTKIPAKYKELIGLGVAAAIRCPYCTFFHTEAARFHGAGDGEVKEALAVAAQTALFSTYLNGSQYDVERFRREVVEALDAIRRKVAVGVPK